MLKKQPVLSFTLCCWLCALLSLALSLFLIPQHSRADEPSPDQPRLPLLLHETFDKDADRWEPTDAKAWKLVQPTNRDSRAYSLFQASKYSPPVRSPVNYSLLKDLNLGEFTLDVQAQSTGRDYGHRDLCLIFGYQGPQEFYYVHLARNADDHANQIFIVNKAPRVKISQTTTEGTKWDDNWHKLRLTRNPADGAIAVYFDDLEKPVMTASDKTFAWGRVGVGSFDDTGNFDELFLYGEEAAK
ncbi:MAG: hypothetical protein SFX18_03265 [Pirellulales bacterium]|nr:hypothetical protein [Pirellulales bacterium]